MSNIIYRATSTPFVSTEIESYLKLSENRSWWDCYQIMFFKDESNKILVVEASLWHRLWAIVSSIFCFCCSSYAKSLTGVEATLITVDEVRELAKTAKTANEVGVKTLDTRPSEGDVKHIEPSIPPDSEASALLRQDIAVYEFEEGEELKGGQLPKKLVDLVLGEDNYRIPLTSDTPYLEEIINFEKNIVDACGSMAGFNLLVKLLEHNREHPTVFLHNYLGEIRENITKHWRDPKSKFHLTKEQYEKCFNIESPVNRLIKSCEEAPTAEAFVEVLKRYDSSFVRHFAHLLKESYKAILKNVDDNQKDELRETLRPYFGEMPT